MNWTGPDWTGPDWTGLDWTRGARRALDFFRGYGEDAVKDAVGMYKTARVARRARVIDGWRRRARRRRRNRRKRRNRALEAGSR